KSGAMRIWSFCLRLLELLIRDRETTKRQKINKTMSIRLRGWRVRLAIWLDIMLIAGIASWILTSPKEDIASTACNGYTEVVKKMLAKGADVNMKAKDGNTPLLYAALNGQTEVVKVLLEAGADKNARDVGGRTPLILAARYMHWGTMEALIAGGADVN